MDVDVPRPGPPGEAPSLEARLASLTDALECLSARVEALEVPRVRPDPGRLSLAEPLVAIARAREALVVTDGRAELPELPELPAGSDDIEAAEGACVVVEISDVVEQAVSELLAERGMELAFDEELAYDVAVIVLRCAGLLGADTDTVGPDC